MPKDYYAILGVSRAADSATIHSAFRTLARQYHPDAGSGSSASKFREVLEAYHTLSDPARRRRHDINLGEAIRSHGVTAEPLFDPAVRLAPVCDQLLPVWINAWPTFCASWSPRSIFFMVAHSAYVLLK